MFQGEFSDVGMRFLCLRESPKKGRPKNSDWEMIATSMVICDESHLGLQFYDRDKLEVSLIF